MLAAQGAPSGDSPHRVHLDHAAATPLSVEARATLLAALDVAWPDPDRLDPDSRRARLLLDAARAQVAAEIGAAPSEVSFVANATLAAALAVAGLTGNAARSLVLGAVEAAPLLRAAAALGEARNPVASDPLGRLDAAALVKAADETPGGARRAVVAMQSANGEVGTRQPVAELAALLAPSATPHLLDAGASLGIERVTLPRPGALIADLATCGGPVVGVLAVAEGTRFRSLVPSDGREGGRSPGRLFLPAVLAGAAALSARAADLEQRARRHARQSAWLRERLGALPGAVVHGDADPAGRLPSLVSVSLLYLSGEELLGRLAAHGFTVGSGSACVADSLEPSHVLLAIGALTSGNVRITLGPETTDAELDRLVPTLAAAVADLREETGVSDL